MKRFVRNEPRRAIILVRSKTRQKKKHTSKRRDKAPGTARTPSRLRLPPLCIVLEPRRIALRPAPLQGPPPGDAVWQGPAGAARPAGTGAGAPDPQGPAGGLAAPVRRPAARCDARYRRPRAPPRPACRGLNACPLHHRARAPGRLVCVGRPARPNHSGRVGGCGVRPAT